MNIWNMQFVAYVDFYHPPLKGLVSTLEYLIFQFVINVLDAEISHKPEISTKGQISCTITAFSCIINNTQKCCHLSAKRQAIT